MRWRRRRDVPAELAALDAEMNDWLSRRRREWTLSAVVVVGVFAVLLYPVWLPLLRTLGA